MSLILTDNLFVPATSSENFSATYTVNTAQFAALIIKLCSSGGDCNFVTGEILGSGSGAFAFARVYTTIGGIAISSITYTISFGTVTLTYGQNNFIITANPGQKRDLKILEDQEEM